MAASITAKTATATGSLIGGRTRLKAFVVRSAVVGLLRQFLKQAVPVALTFNHDICSR